MGWLVTARAICMWRISSWVASPKSHRRSPIAHSPPGSSGPNLISMDSQGNLFVADYFGGSTHENYTGWNAEHIGSGLLSRKKRLAVNSIGRPVCGGGHCQLANSGTILEITPGGVQSTFATGCPILPGWASMRRTIRCGRCREWQRLQPRHTRRGQRSAFANRIAAAYRASAIQPVPEPSVWAMFGERARSRCRLASQGVTVVARAL